MKSERKKKKTQVHWFWKLWTVHLTLIPIVYICRPSVRPPPPLFLVVLRLHQIAACNFCTAVPLGIKDVGLGLHNTVGCCCGFTQTCLYLLQYITSWKSGAIENCKTEPMMAMLQNVHTVTVLSHYCGALWESADWFLKIAISQGASSSLGWIVNLYTIRLMQGWVPPQAICWMSFPCSPVCAHVACFNSRKDAGNPLD